jgi:hypothetical protein
MMESWSPARVAISKLLLYLYGGNFFFSKKKLEWRIRLFLEIFIFFLYSIFIFALPAKRSVFVYRLPVAFEQEGVSSPIYSSVSWHLADIGREAIISDPDR